MAHRRHKHEHNCIIPNLGQVKRTNATLPDTLRELSVTCRKCKSLRVIGGKVWPPSWTRMFSRMIHQRRLCGSLTAPRRSLYATTRSLVRSTLVHASLLFVLNSLSLDESRIVCRGTDRKVPYDATSCQFRHVNWTCAPLQCAMVDLARSKDVTLRRITGRSTS